jgi:hypothetical protein
MLRPAMEPALGRYFEGRLLATTLLLKQLHDCALGQGKDVAAWIEGQELVFGRGAPRSGRGFLRLLPGDAHVVVAFPRAPELFDPQRRLRGPRGSQAHVVLTVAGGLDPYTRRLVECAHAVHR